MAGATRHSEYKFWGPYLTEKKYKEGNRTKTYWAGKILFAREGETKRQSRTRSFRTATKTDANIAAAAWLEELKAEIEKSERLRKTELDVPTLVESFIDSDERTNPSIQASTVRDYRKSAKYLHVGLDGHGFEGIAPQDLTSRQVEEWRDWLLTSGKTVRNEDGTTSTAPLGYVTVRKAQACLKHYLKVAQSKRYIDSNPCDDVKLAEPPKMQLDAYGNTQTDADSLNAPDAKERTRIVNMVYAVRPEGYAAAIVLATYAGLRRSEIAALRWRDLDFERGAIHVERALGETKKGTLQAGPVGSAGKQATQHSTYEKVTKSRAGKREVPMLDDCGEYLAMWRDRCECVCAENGLVLSPDAYVCGDPLTGTHASMRNIGARVRAFMEMFEVTNMNGTRPTLHDLRRAFRAWLEEEMEVSNRALKAYMGHTPQDVTGRNYGAFDFDGYRETAKAKAKAHPIRISGTITTPTGKVWQAN